MGASGPLYGNTMDTEQLVSAVNHMKAQKAAIDYLSEGLTKVLELDQAKAAADKHVHTAKAEVEKAKADLEQVKADHASELDSFDKTCADKIADAAARAANLVAEANIKVAEVEAKLDSLEHQTVQREEYLEALHASIAQQSASLEAIHREYDSVKSKLAAIKAGL